MLWSDKAFSIYMGDAGTLARVDAVTDASDTLEAQVARTDVRESDPCSDGETRRPSWLARRGTSLTDTQVHGAVRG